MTPKSAFSFFLVCIAATAFAQTKPVTYLFIGSYTEGRPDTGLYVYAFNPKSGALKLRSSVENITNPSYLALSHDGHYLYAGADTQLPDTGSVIAFRVDSESGKLSFINRQPSKGDNPVYIAVHLNNRYLIEANYTGGSVSAFSINKDGGLNPSAQTVPFEGNSIMKERQEKAHIHAAVFSPQYDYVYLPDLGSDKIWVFRFDTSAARPLIPVPENDITTIPGSGPRHFVFHPNGKFAYCIEELSGMVSVYVYDRGKLDHIQRIFGYSKVQDSYGGADIHVSPDGRFVYSSNRWEDENTIAIFDVHQESGVLTLLGHQKTYGDHPRNFTIDPTGKYLLVANMLSNNIVVFKRNMKTGLLKKTKHEINISSPSCLQMRVY